MYWKPGWIEPDKTKWIKSLNCVLARPSWIIDGNDNSTLESRLETAEIEVLLDLPREVCLWRVLRRTMLIWGRTRLDMAEDCPERFDPVFFHYIWTFRQKQLPLTLERLSRFKGGTVRLRTARQIEEFVAAIDSMSKRNAEG